MTNSDTQTIDPSKILDVREEPCETKLSNIRARWIALPVNDYFVLINGHEPVPLRHQMEAEFPGAFSWDNVQQSASEVHVKITKHKEITAEEGGKWTCPSSGE